MIRNAASSVSPELVSEASSTVKAVSSFRLKRFDSTSSRFQIDVVRFRDGDGYLVRPFGLLVGHAIGFERRQPGAVERVNRSIEAFGDDRPRRDRALRRVSLVMKSCQGPVLPSGRAGDAKDFFKRSLAGTNLQEAIFVERVKACFTRELLDRALVLASSSNRVADVVVDDKQFGYRRPAAITGIAARLAANRLPAVRKIDRRIAC